MSIERFKEILRLLNYIFETETDLKKNYKLEHILTYLINRGITLDEFKEFIKIQIKE
jgi:hypothetical protein